MNDNLNPMGMDLDAARLAVAELKRYAVRLHDEIQEGRRWMKADAQSIRGEGHSRWCDEQLSGGLCNCGMQLHWQINRLTGILSHVRDTDRMHAEDDWEREQLSRREG